MIVRGEECILSAGHAARFARGTRVEKRFRKRSNKGRSKFVSVTEKKERGIRGEMAR
jgi:hypothetical protein